MSADPASVQSHSRSGSNVHARKRQFQPAITSFFHKGVAAHVFQDGNDGGDGEVHGVHRQPLSPPLPEDTQASLLSVGMRVRKSVPEGYKTHKTLSVPDLPFSSTTPVKTATHITTTVAPAGVDRPLFSSQRSTELQPFCGLHKTGGLAQQQQQQDWRLPTSSAPAAFKQTSFTGDSLPGLTTSQSTLASSQDSLSSIVSRSQPFGQNRKRTYEEEMEDDMDAIFDEFDSSDMDGDYTKSSSGRDSHASVSRPIAKLKRPGPSGPADHVSASVLDGCDFDEAPFLQPPDSMDL